MQTFSGYTAVGTAAPVRIFTFKPCDLHSVVVQPAGDVEVGVGGIAVGEGFPVPAGGVLGFTHRDFAALIGDDLTTLVVVYAIASVATNVRVFGWRR